MEQRGIEYLRKKLNRRKTRVLLRYKEYDMKYKGAQLGLTIPPELRAQYAATLGWCAKAVDSLADRLIFREFDEDNFNLNKIFQMNNPDTLFDSAILSALISSCSFIYISQGDDIIPRLQVIDGANATGVIDPITGLMTEGYAVLERDDAGKATLEAHFVTGRTDYYENGILTQSIKNAAPYPLLVPIIHRPDAVRPFGRSRITRAAMYYQAYAKRTLERADITAEFYSFPQKYVVGLSQDAEPMDAWKATISSMLQFTKDEDGDAPKLGQFTQPSMSPFTEQLRTAAAGFAGETGLTLDDLGFVSENPSSAEAIKASHETLRVAAKKAQRNFGSSFLNVGYLAACLRDEFPYQRSQLYLTTPKWEPVFEADASTLSLIGDGVIKINQAIPDYFDEKTLRDLTGVKGGEVKDIVPDLLKAIEDDFNDRYEMNQIVQRISRLIDSKRATYKEANQLAVELGEILAKTFKVHLSAEVLPDGKMYYNIAERLLNKTLGDNHELIATATEQIQTHLNELSRIGIRGIKPPLNQSRIDGLIEKAVDGESFQAISWVFDEPVKNFSQSIVDEAIMLNAEFQQEAGLEPTLTRTVVADCCDWCRNLSGTYKVSEAPEDIYRRHQYCRCTVEYDPGSGRKRDIHRKTK